MKFQKDLRINGTCLKGYLAATYDELVAVFGEPTCGPDDRENDKVTCEWQLLFEDGTYATIYDWKTDHTPMRFYDWHIGGKSFAAVLHITETFDNHMEKQNA
jgi:hypothetical protein